jgi:hypothetical protein
VWENLTVVKGRLGQEKAAGRFFAPSEEIPLFFAGQRVYQHNSGVLAADNVDHNKEISCSLFWRDAGWG